MTLQQIEHVVKNHSGSEPGSVEIQSKTERIMSELSQVLTWFIFIAVTALLCIEVRNKCQSSERRWRAKNVELAGFRGSEQSSPGNRNVCRA